MKVNINKCLIIIVVSAILGLIYNFVSPSGINLLPQSKEIKWASDSLVSSSLKTIDTNNTNIKVQAFVEGKSLSYEKAETVKSSIKADSIKQNRVKQETRGNINEDEGFAEPIGINLEQANKLYEMGLLFIDARDESEYKTGHIKNSINLPIYEFERFKNILSRVPKSQTIVCYCGGTDCDLSTQLAKKLFSLGYKNNYIFIGGWEQWKAAGYMTE
jgi:rhodanese-related sulfurtransferase